MPVPFEELAHVGWLPTRPSTRRRRLFCLAPDAALVRGGTYRHTLDGIFEIQFEKETLIFEVGDGIYIPARAQDKHIAKTRTDTVRAVFSEDVWTLKCSYFRMRYFSGIGLSAISSCHTTDAIHQRSFLKNREKLLIPRVGLPPSTRFILFSYVLKTWAKRS